jgi:hydrogenase maturation factor
MREAPRLGKAGQSVLESVVYRSLGASSSRLAVGPAFGLDNSIVRLGHGRVLVATSDPLSYIPSLGPEASAWLSVHLLASDLTTSGFSPQFGLFDFNLPPTLSDPSFAKYWRSFHQECKKLGLSIIGGHTGRYPGIDYTIVGGGVVMAIGPKDHYLTSSMAHNGDDVVLTKGAAIETTAVLTRTFPHRVRKTLGSTLFDKAWNYLYKVTTVEDALAASSIGVRHRGVTAMHDATEGGVTAGLIELTTASSLGLNVDLEQIHVSAETQQLCGLFRIDPLVSLSEGSLVIASRPTKTEEVRAKLSSRGISSTIVGSLTSRFRGCRATTSKGTRSLGYPDVDPYWKAYSKAIKQGWT